jgi:hypothetical protein
MSATILWQGLTVVDEHGRVTLWHGSQTPKLYRTDEQARYGLTNGQQLLEVTILAGRIVPGASNAPAPAAASAPAPQPARPRRAMRFSVRLCDRCHKPFTPTGGRSRYCGCGT